MLLGQYIADDVVGRAAHGESHPSRLASVPEGAKRRSSTRSLRCSTLFRVAFLQGRTDEVNPERNNEEQRMCVGLKSDPDIDAELPIHQAAPIASDLRLLRSFNRESERTNVAAAGAQLQPHLHLDDLAAGRRLGCLAGRDLVLDAPVR